MEGVAHKKRTKNLALSGAWGFSKFIVRIISTQMVWRQLSENHSGVGYL